MLLACFMRVLDLTKAASIVILLVLLARFALKKAPKVFSYGLWAVVLLRLLCPFALESPFSVMPNMQPVAENYPLAEVSISPAEAGLVAYHAVGDALNGGLGIQQLPVTEGAAPVTALWGDVWLLVGQYVWLAGMVGMAVWAAASYLRLRRRLVTASPLRDNLYLADEIASPFVLGLVRPKIYLPSSLGEREQTYIILHEQTHIRRGDHIWKALGFAALCIHWFNPLVWSAFVLAGKDLEMSCDEAVVKKMGEGVLADYAASLLSLATGRKIIAGMPLAFGEGDPKSRIKNLANWKKPAFWGILAAVAVCMVLAVCLLTNPLTLSGKLAVSMDMAVANSYEGENYVQFFALDYDVLGIEKKAKTTTVYAWILYQGYRMDGGEIRKESGASIPTAITFDTTGSGSTYDVLEYWEPRDGSYYAGDIREKFPLHLWRRALNNAHVKEQIARCNQAAEEYFSSYEGPRHLTLDDVLFLAQKGNALTWEDFADYESKDIGSGLYILVYEIDRQYCLMIGGVPGITPMYIRLYADYGTEAQRYAEVRTDDLEGFLAGKSAETMWTAQKIQTMFAAVQEDEWVYEECVVIDDHASDRVAAVLFRDKASGTVQVAFFDSDGYFQQAGTYAPLAENPEFTYLGNGTVTWKALAENGEEYSYKLTLRIDGANVYFQVEDDLKAQS